MTARRTVAAALVWATLATLVVGCSGPRRPATDDGARPERAARSLQLPSGCDVATVGATLTSYLTSYSSGRAVAVDDHFAPVAEDRVAPQWLSRGFQWFADNGGLEPGGFVAYWSGSRLRDYIRSMQDAGDEQALVELYVNSYDPKRDWASFAIIIRRERPGLESNLTLGKGAVRCGDLLITLWNLGPPGGGEDRPSLCDQDAMAGEQIVLCTR